MSANELDRIGVVVIHGVGPTTPGWIDDWLVPELEKWRAFENAQAGSRKPEKNDLILSLPTADKYIAVALDSDEDFANFCAATNQMVLTHDVRFKTRDLRVKNRYDLKEKAWVELQKHDHEYWLDRLRQHAPSVPAAIAFKPSSEVHHVRDPEASKPTETWTSFTRRWPLDDREVLVTELFWADMSVVGTTTFSRSTALAQLFLESPYILGQAFLRGSDRGIGGLVHRIVSASNWLMRWPIAGITVAVFVSAFAVLLLQQLEAMDWLVPAIASALLLTAFVGYKLFQEWVHGKPGLADLSLAASLNALLLLGLLIVAFLINPDLGLAPPEAFLIAGVAFVLAGWALWSILMTLAIILVTLLALWRLLFKGGADTIPINRPAAATALSALLGIIWKIVLAIFGILIIKTLFPDAVISGSSCPMDVSLRTVVFTDLTLTCQVAQMKLLLSQISIANIIGLLLVLLTVATVVGVRKARMRILHERAESGTLTLPRLIANPFIVAMLLFVSIVTAANFYIPQVADLFLVREVQAFLYEHGAETIGTGALGLVIFLFLIGRIVEMSDGFVHIGRDLVDHQYDRDPRSLAMRLARNSREQRSGARTERRRLRMQRMFSKNPGAVEEGGEHKKYRRRQRIQKRLEALIDEVIEEQKCRRLIFFAHSQGTVILRDYLVDHDNLVGKEHAARGSLYDVERIDVLTIGSPLLHIYRYYFSEYDKPKPGTNAMTKLIEKVDSWTNMWRVDDPIGQQVEVDLRVAAAGAPEVLLENIGIAPGGHTNYWKESKVCEQLWRLIMSNHPRTDRPGGMQIKEQAI